MPSDQKSPPLDLCKNLTPERVADHVNKNRKDQHLSVGACKKYDAPQCFHLYTPPRIDDCIHTSGNCSFTPMKSTPLKEMVNEIESFCSYPNSDDEICKLQTVENLKDVLNKRRAREGHYAVIKDGFFEEGYVKSVAPVQEIPLLSLMDDYKQKCGMDLP